VGEVALRKKTLNKEGLVQMNERPGELSF